MRLLVVTQKIDQADPVLGFFVSWVKELTKRFEKITVICLEKGGHSLPAGIKILSLGKETKQSRLRYLTKFYHYLWRERHNYDVVFVHMNQEYVLLAGLWWRFQGKKIMLWRNHPQGGLLARLAVMLAHKVFCTSPFSYTAKFKKTVLMPVGIEVDKFKPSSSVNDKGSKIKGILFLGRLSPIKRVELFIETLKKLITQDVDFQATIIGSPVNKSDIDYENKLHQLGQELVSVGKLTFVKAVSPEQTPIIYNRHNIYVNLTPSGSFDKTILEAMACGTLVLIANRSLSDFLPTECQILNLEELPEKLTGLLNLPAPVQEKLGNELRQIVVSCHSLVALMSKIADQSKML